MVFKAKFHTILQNKKKLEEKTLPNAHTYNLPPT
jgi:hypothetical protein